MRESKYKTLTDWKKADPRAYDAAKKQDLIAEICTEFGWENTSIPPYGRKQLEKEEIIELAQLSKTLEKFGVKHPRAYRQADRLDMLEEVKENIGKRVKPKDPEYTKEAVLELANKSYSMYLFESDHKNAYKIAAKNGWLDDVADIFWKKGEDVRIFGLFTSTKEFNDLFDKFKERVKKEGLNKVQSDLAHH